MGVILFKSSIINSDPIMPVSELHYYEHVTLHKCFLHQPKSIEWQDSPTFTYNKKYVTLRWLCFIPPFHQLVRVAASTARFCSKDGSALTSGPSSFHNGAGTRLSASYASINTSNFWGPGLVGEKTNPETSTKKTKNLIVPE